MIDSGEGLAAQGAVLGEAEPGNTPTLLHFALFSGSGNPYEKPVVVSSPWAQEPGMPKQGFLQM